MSVYTIDPLQDPRWPTFVERHPLASAFHSTGWLRALQRTYRYRPVVLTTSPPDETLQNGLALCAVKSLAGNRLVSLPFSDHCEPLVDRVEDAAAIRSFLAAGVESGSWTSFELRPLIGSGWPSATELRPSRQYVFHRCDLTPSLDQVFARFHPSCVRRAIRRAEREGVEYQSGSSRWFIDSFFRLLRITRRRHGLVPQPIAWFRNLAATLGDAMRIHVATHGGAPIAAIVTLRFRNSLVYKYGASDARFHNLGGMPFLFWRAIQDACATGCQELDLGRSDIGQDGLAAFKERLGAERLTLTYYRHPQLATGDDWQVRAVRWMFERLPDPALIMAGRVLYKHLA